MHYNRSSTDVNYLSTDANRSQNGSQIRLGHGLWGRVKSVFSKFSKAKSKVTSLTNTVTNTELNIINKITPENQDPDVKDATDAANEYADIAS